MIVFYRGGWCPYCNLTLRTYERELLPQLGAYPARLVADPPRDHDTTLPMPTVLVVDRDHVARYVDIHPDYTARTEVTEILAALHRLPS